MDVTDNGHTHDKSLLIPIEDSKFVDMKYFPNAPASNRRVFCHFCHLYLFSSFKSHKQPFKRCCFIFNYFFESSVKIFSQN